MAYWINLFTGTTWQEFQKAGASVSGFRDHQRTWTVAGKIKPGDVFLCYMVGVKRWVGVLDITSERFRDMTTIFSRDEEAFPVRFRVMPRIILAPEHGVPMESLEGKLTGFPIGASTSQWAGIVRGSLRKFSDDDANVVVAALEGATVRPVLRPVDPRQLKRPANIYKVKSKQDGQEVETIVSVPSVEDDDQELDDLHNGDGQPTTHSEIQWRLLNLGSLMGLNVWAPNADRGRNWNGNKIGDVPTLLGALPTQFDAATTKTIENIDVLWLSGNAIVAAFEVEHTTSIYSGLLRMADLLTMQPNIDIKLYLVGPDERYAKFTREVPRPTFASRSKPLHKVCRFLPYSKLCHSLEAAKTVLKHLKPEFLDDIAELYDPADDADV